jgi:hypothetical protein
MPSSQRFIFFTRFICLLCLAAGISGCAGIGEAEYQPFKPMRSDVRLRNQVKLTWEVREDVGDFCLRAQQNNQGNLPQGKPLACAIWVAATHECKVVTGPNPNHVVLGHEVRHCFEGHFHR